MDKSILFYIQAYAQKSLTAQHKATSAKTSTASNQTAVGSSYLACTTEGTQPGDLFQGQLEPVYESDP